MREVFLGTHRFEALHGALGIARNVLQGRLERLVDEGILRRVLYEQHPRRYEYRLTRKGTDLWPVLFALLNWGDRHASPEGPPLILEHRGCGGEIDERRRCTACGAELAAWEVIAKHRSAQRAGR